MAAHVSKLQKYSGFKWIVPEPFAFLGRTGNAGSGNEIDVYIASENQAEVLSPVFTGAYASAVSTSWSIELFVLSKNK